MEAPTVIRTGIVHYGCLFRKQDRYGAMVGAEGLEPSWSWLKARCLSSSASLPVAGLRIELNCADL